MSGSYGVRSPNGQREALDSALLSDSLALVQFDPVGAWGGNPSRQNSVDGQYSDPERMGDPSLRNAAFVQGDDEWDILCDEERRATHQLSLQVYASTVNPEGSAVNPFVNPDNGVGRKVAT